VGAARTDTSGKGTGREARSDTKQHRIAIGNRIIGGGKSRSYRGVP